MPERIQLRRSKGWRKPPATIVVARPTKWGNPFWVTLGQEAPAAEGWAVSSLVSEAMGVPLSVHGTQLEATQEAIRLFEQAIRSEGNMLVPSIAEIRAVLRGFNLGCWCRLDMPCHADVLLAIANEETHG